MRTLPKTVGSLAALALALSVGSAQAAFVNFTLTGDVVFADTGNLFGLSSGSTITVTGVFDDAGLIGGTGDISFADAGNSFTAYVGNYTFTETDDISGSPYPLLSLNAGAFADFNFLADIGTSGYFDSLAGFFDGDDDNAGIISGTWNDISITAVPVPAAVWLFGSGLLGLVGVARRKGAA